MTDGPDLLKELYEKCSECGGDDQKCEWCCGFGIVVKDTQECLTDEEMAVLEEVLEEEDGEPARLLDDW